MVKRHFDYEEKYRNLQQKFLEFKKMSQNMDFDLSQEFKRLEDKMEDIRGIKYGNLSPWEKVLLSRHSARPVVGDYIEYLFEDWIELHGDRSYGDDRAIIGGIADFAGTPVSVLGHRKGRGTNENLKNNFGMPHPEGFRKVERLIGQAEKFKRPIITFIDTPGAYPGLGAEERGQAWAIAQVLMLFPHLQVPTIAIVTGEGGSGGALALAAADRLLMLSNSVFSVASAEACSSIIWKDASRAEEMASYLKVTAEDLKDLGMVDEIIPEPVGGAQQDFTELADRLKASLQSNLKQLLALSREELLVKRYQRFRGIGRYLE